MSAVSGLDSLHDTYSQEDQLNEFYPMLCLAPPKQLRYMRIAAWLLALRRAGEVTRMADKGSCSNDALGEISLLPRLEAAWYLSLTLESEAESAFTARLAGRPCLCTVRGAAPC